MAADYRKIARQKARKYRVPEAVFLRQIKQESGFNPNARSPAGATGIAQIMPATARGWGVNPNDPVASLEAAAKNMGRYIKAYGLEGALRAYNAGPGAIEKSKGYAETNNYVQRILGGLDPQQRQGGGGGGGNNSTVTTPATDTRREVSVLDAEGLATAQRRAKIASFIGKRNPQSTLLRLGVLNPATPDPAQFMRTETVGKFTPGRSAAAALPDDDSARGGGPRGTLRELFYNGPGGANVDDGRKVGKGYVSGHTDHAHAAFDNDRDRNEAVSLAKRLGLTITSEGGGKHAAGSFHYQKTRRGKSRAIDVAGDPEKMALFSRKLARRFVR
jgi:hypothetical protein